MAALLWLGNSTWERSSPLALCCLGAANKEQVDIRGMKASTEKIMSSELPRRVARLLIRLEIPGVANAETRRKLEAAARACPVHKPKNRSRGMEPG